MKRAWAFRLLIFLAVVFMAGLFICRSSILQWAFKREQSHYKDKYHLNIHAADVRLLAWNRVGISRLVVQADSADTLAVITNLEIEPSIVPLLSGTVVINEISMDSALVTVYSLPDRDNVHFLKTDTNAGSKSNGKSNYYSRAENLSGRFLKMLNTAFDIKKLKFCYRDTSFVEQINVPYLTYDRQHISGLIINELLLDTLAINGEAIGSSHNFSIYIKHQGNALNYLPFFDKENGFKCRFNSVSANINLDNAGDELRISPAISVQDFHINHWRLAKEDVVFNKGQFKGLIKINADGIELDSTSSVTLNNTGFNVFSAYHTQPDTFFALNIRMPETASDTFFNALPGGMFNTLKGISCSGTLAYNLIFKINTRQPDSLIFDSQLKRKNFRIIHMGEENYARINEPFVYDAFSGGQFIRHITVGPENPDFVSIGRISPYLKECIWQSEDPSFMAHRGFVPESFRESIAENYKQHRFARGGSTITMQLVKNVFLNRNKTISRKAEEALIVYLIENMGLVPKERMMEVYLNVIEWGPNVYGATEAARFYFNKKPNELTLQECIFLAAIIPNPKYFRYQFDKQGEIKPYMADFFKIIAGRLVLRGYIPAADTINFVPHVKLSGPALQMVVPTDSLTPATDEAMPGME